jgi:gliding motility-associated-like protein
MTPNTLLLHPPKITYSPTISCVPSNALDSKRHYSEYIQTTFSEDLQKGNRYVLSLWYKSSAMSTFTDASLNYVLSSDKINNFYSTSINQPYFGKFHPSIKKWENISDFMLPSEWTLFTDTITALEDYRHLTLGSFDIEFKSLDYSRFERSYFFIDNISLVALPRLYGPDTLCVNDTAHLYSTFKGPHQWSFDSKFHNVLSKDSILNLIIDETKWIYHKTPTGEDSLIINVISPPSIDQLEYTICNKDTVLINLDKEFEYVWFDNSLDPIKKLTEEGNYSVSINNGYCKNQQSIIIHKESISLDAHRRNLTFCLQEQNSITVNLPETYSYFWEEDNSISSIKNFIDEGCYPFEYSSKNCKVKDSICITHICKSAVWIPNAFAPNGINDRFSPYLEDVTEATLTVYNRWGEKLYTETSNHPSWDGYYNNFLSSSGIYLYTLRINGIQKGDVKHFKGTFYLLD